MRFYKSSMYRLFLILLLLLILQACSTFRTCGAILKNEDYLSSPHYKAIAGYFDRETLRPPAQIKHVENECWFDFQGNSQEEADSIVLIGCEESLKQIDQFDEWSCILIAQGNQLTDAEQQRVDNWERLGKRTPNEDSQMLINNTGLNEYNPDGN